MCVPFRKKENGPSSREDSLMSALVFVHSLDRSLGSFLVGFIVLFSFALLSETLLSRLVSNSGQPVGSFLVDFEHHAALS